VVNRRFAVRAVGVGGDGDDDRDDRDDDALVVVAVLQFRVLFPRSRCIDL